MPCSRRRGGFRPAVAFPSRPSAPCPLAPPPSLFFPRAHLLPPVWRYASLFSTCPLHLHVRRQRPHPGPEHQPLLVTVRNVGHRFVTPEHVERAAADAAAHAVTLPAT
ncbi:hypothetical protein DRB96_40455 [Streptomyces sp. ICC1]|nr:hypothetical protein DRB96_40455 [Streptomyces sp. ICC1]